jgi:lipoprotein-anchoring transpeptidase ErfK/SrfK
VTDSSDFQISVSIPRQTLELVENGKVIKSYAVSTARNGSGERMGSECTPRGRHVIRARIGSGCAPGTVFVARRPTGETWSPQLAQSEPDRDWILTRILWLSGKQRGFNRMANVDTMRRYIYIHGTPYEEEIGSPVSHGCIRMRSEDLVELFDLVDVGTPVIIDD